MDKKKNNAHYHTPEVLALFLLKAYGELSEEAQIKDKPDIIDKDVTVEVVTALGGASYNQSLFSEEPETKIDARDYVCKECLNYKSCAGQSSLDPLVLCSNAQYLKKKKKTQFVVDGYVPTLGALYFKPGQEHPQILPYSVAVKNESSLIKEAIEEKERKAPTYVKKPVNNLFVFCASWPESFSDITFDTFDNIYLFRPGSEELYKNGKPLATSKTIQHALYRQVQQYIKEWAEAENAKEEKKPKKC